MAQVTLPYTLTPGTPENVNNLMSNLTALRDGVNTIDTAQIANGAVTAAKLASGVVPAAATYVTSLPSSPTDGQEIYYAANATNGVIWHFRYRSAASKWEFVGGPPLVASVATTQTTTSTSYTALTTAGPSITLPLAGDYDVTIGADIYGGYDSSFNPVSAMMSYDIGATGASNADAIIYGAYALTASVSSVRRKTGLSAVTLTAKYKANSNPANAPSFSNRFMLITPVRI